jgi:hypothetical protein
MRNLVPSVKVASDRAPLAEFVAVDCFERVGTFLEVQDWRQYAEMLTQWASSIDSFETTVRRISELNHLVYYEIEGRHHGVTPSTWSTRSPSSSSTTTGESGTSTSTSSSPADAAPSGITGSVVASAGKFRPATEEA